MDLELPYIAGFFDGEGSIGIYKGGGIAGRTLRCQITQTITPESTELLTACRDRWGGSLAQFNRQLRRVAYNWQTSGANAMQFLCEVRPWLRLKAQQADIAINWQRLKPEPRRGSDGRMLPQLPGVEAWHEQTARALTALKLGEPIDVVREGTKDLVEVPHALWQIVNFEHHWAR